MVNLSSFVKYHALNSPERVAISYEGSYLTYQELSYRIERLAGFLLNKDLEPNDVVAVLMKNSPAFIEIAFAVSHIGAIFLPINYRLASKIPDSLHDTLYMIVATHWEVAKKVIPEQPE